MSNADMSLADELNTFYARFEAAANDAKANAIANAKGCRQEENANTGNTFIISEHDLAPVFTEIFNLSLTQLVIHTCFKESIIVPVPKENLFYFPQQLLLCSPDLSSDEVFGANVQHLTLKYPPHSPPSWEDLGLSPSLCQWISNFLTGRLQAVRMSRHVSASLTLSTGAPQGCVLSPLLYSLYTYDCVATTNSTTVIKFADDTVVVRLISDNNETAYL
ncbi:hypothetical protein QTP86_026456 [Hemibagrus guttatus]|nr:hypothetical protein QTP86_026456 [Hemibagrus guttatus]